MKRYTTMIVSDPYTAEIYQNCRSTIERRSDGERLRITQPGTRWHGNTGGYHETVTYVKGRLAVRRYWRAMRSLQCRAIRNGDSPRHWSVLDLSYNY